jgi:CRP-like cAMP-binding protein
MSKQMHFQSGMTIYLEEAISDCVFVVQSGSVSLSYADLETEEIRQEILKPGEFFGVKSALGKYPREETASVLQDSVVIAFTVPEFEAMVLKNPRIIMRMLSVYSSQLRKLSRLLSSFKIQSHIRRYGKDANRRTEARDSRPEKAFFNMGKYYLSKRDTEKALYIFKKYVQDYPAGEYLKEAEGYLATLGGRTR